MYGTRLERVDWTQPMSSKKTIDHGDTQGIEKTKMRLPRSFLPKSKSDGFVHRQSVLYFTVLCIFGGVMFGIQGTQ
jgi:hypothetical protein